MAKLGASSMLVLPILSQNAFVGAVMLGFKGDHALTDEERARARMLGDRVGVAFATAVKDEQLYYQANYDALTALPNRLYFKDQLARRLAQAQRETAAFRAAVHRPRPLQDDQRHAAAMPRATRCCGRRPSV